MKDQQHGWGLLFGARRSVRAAIFASMLTSLVLLLVGATTAPAANSWDRGGGTSWWFDTDNWSEDAALVLPPMSDGDNDPGTNDLSITDTLINWAPPVNPNGDYNDDGIVNGADYTVWRDNMDNPMFDLPNEGVTEAMVTEEDFDEWRDHWGETTTPGNGEVVFDPTNDPGYAAAGSLRYTAPYDRDTIWRMYLGRYPTGGAVTEMSTLTIRGDLDTHNNTSPGTTQTTQWQVGRTSGTAGTPANGMIIQESGVVRNGYGDIDLGSNDSNPGVNYFGNGTYDYRGGTLEQGLIETNRRLRLSAGGSGGIGGVGTFIMHNPGEASPGHVRVSEFLVAAFGGQGGLEPNGVTQGVGIVEFHYEDGGTRPMQIQNNLTLANGGDAGADTGVRSSRLRLVLDEAPTVDMGGVPINLGLLDINSDLTGLGAIIGPAAGPNDYGLTFSNADAVDPLAASAVYDNLVDGIAVAGSDNIVSAVFGGTMYRWRIHYDGDITWANEPADPLTEPRPGYDASIVAGITGAGTGTDIVLIGLDSMIVGSGGFAAVPEPSTLLMSLAAVLGLFAMRRRG